MFDIFDINETENFPKIKVIGVGGGGINAVNRMIEKKLSGVEFVAVDTYETFLSTSQAPCKIKIDENDIQASSKEILTVLEGNDLVFIVAGIGGGTATGVAPIIAKYSKKLGALTIAVVTLPFNFENPRRKKNADIGIENLRDFADSVVKVSGDKILQLEENISQEKALSIANDVLFETIKGISYLMTMPGIVNLDFADVKGMLENSGTAFVGIGEASGTNAALNAAKNALYCPLIENIQGAYSILLNVAASEDSLEMSEVMEVSNMIQDAANENAEIMWGVSIDPSLGDTVKVMIIENAP
jgi:cell division protein FtsZ